eukprot:tig00000042_g15551.t1
MGIDELPAPLLARVLRLAARRGFPRPAPGRPKAFAPWDEPVATAAEEEEAAAAGIDVDLRRLARLRAVCRSFAAALELEPDACAFLSVSFATDACATALERLPAACAAAVRGVALVDSRLSAAGVARLAAALSKARVERLEVRVSPLADAEEAAAALVGALGSPGLRASLRRLVFVSPAPVEAAGRLLAGVARLDRLESLALGGAPVGSSALAALAQLPVTGESLSELDVDVPLRFGEGPGPALAAAARLPSLRRLCLRFGDAKAASEADAAPLAALSELRSLRLGGPVLSSLAFLPALPRLEDAALSVSAGADAAPLRRAARLRSLSLVRVAVGSAPSRSLASALSSLPALERLHLVCDSRTLEALAAEPGLSWPRLSLLSLRPSSVSDPLPALLLRRLASAAPSLRSLRLDGPLELPGCLQALGPLSDRLRRVCFGPAAAWALSAPHRALVSNLLPPPSAEIVYEKEESWS